MFLSFFSSSVSLECRSISFSISLSISSISGSSFQKRSSGFGSSSISSCEFRVNRFKSNVISSKLNALAFTDTFSWNESLGSTLGML